MMMMMMMEVTKVSYISHPLIGIYNDYTYSVCTLDQGLIMGLKFLTGVTGVLVESPL